MAHEELVFGWSETRRLSPLRGVSLISSREFPKTRLLPTAETSLPSLEEPSQLGRGLEEPESAPGLEESALGLEEPEPESAPGPDRAEETQLVLSFVTGKSATVYEPSDLDSTCSNRRRDMCLAEKGRS